MDSAEKPIAHKNHQQRQQEVLKCPRCNSSNTKFCYYNNYSLSQPRHFCKDCKRYWTRGGTLRNVPIGGGCRKNKRIKTTLSTVDDSPNPKPNSNPNLDHITPSNNNLKPLYGLLQRNLKYPRFNTRDVSSYDLVQPQNSLGIGVSSLDHGYPLVAHGHSSVPLVSSYPSIFGGGFTSNCNSDHTLSSVLASCLQQQPTFLKMEPYGDDGGSVMNEVQMDDWNTSLNGQNDSDQITSLESSGPTSFLWNITGGDGGEWHDPTSNISVPSLI